MFLGVSVFSGLKQSRREFQIPAIGVIDNIVVTRREVWAYFKVSEMPYTFLSTKAKVSLASNTMSALAGLCQSANRVVDCHILVSNEPFNPEAWSDEVISQFFEYNGVDASTRNVFNKFIADQVEGMYKGGYLKRVTLLGVKLCNRGAFDAALVNPLEFGFGEAWGSVKRGVQKLFLFKEFEISAEEEARFRQLEDVVHNQLASGLLGGARPSAEECLLAMKRRLFPAMPMPFLETDYDSRIGLSDVVVETGAVVEERSRFVRVSQVFNGFELSGVRATLSFSKFPKDLMFPSAVPPFLSRAVVLPFTVNCRFSLIPTEQMRKKLYKKQQDTDDELKNLADSSQRPTESLRATMRDQAVLEKDLEEENLPWVVGHYRVTVEGESEAFVRQAVEGLKSDFSANDFVLNWTSGDQLDLLREEFLGGSLLVKDFGQTTNLALLGLSGINHGGSVGDPVKLSLRTSYRR